jgi:hypothetical protein
MTAPANSLTAARFDRIQAEVYLGHLFSDLSGFIDLRTLSETGPAEQTFHDSIEGTLEQIENTANRKRNVYVGISERRSDAGGTKENLGFCHALWIDVDYKEQRDSGATDERIESFPMPLSLRVWSGGGEHFYWLLNKPLDLSSEETRRRFENTLRGLCNNFFADRAATDSTRILRVPGTTNYPDKKKRSRGRVEAPCIIREVNGHRYHFDDFADFEERGAAVNPDAEEVWFHPSDWDGEIPESVQAAEKGSDTIKRLLHTSYADCQHFDSASEVDWALAVELLGSGVDPTDVENGLLWRCAHVDTRSKPADYFSRTVRKALGRLHSEEASSNQSTPADSRDDAAPAKSDDAPESEARPVVVRVADVESRPLEWLWRGRIPLGKVTVLDGDPGLGKSTLTLDLAARVTTGRPMPDDTPSTQGGVVLLSAEDDTSDTIRPRLEAAGADLARVAVFSAVADRDGERLPEIPLDLSHLEHAINTMGAVLVIVDPLMAFLSPGVNSHHDQDVRRALAPLAKLAERSRAAVVVVRHLNKGAGGTSPIYRGGGSIGIIGAARAGLLLARDPDDDERRVLAVSKCNLARPADALSFELMASISGAVRVGWRGASGHTAEALLAAPADSGERSALDEAKAVLHEILERGPVPVPEVKKLARAAGVADRTLDRAKAALGVMSRKREFAEGWSWALPDDAAKFAKGATSPNPQETGALGGDGALRAESMTYDPPRSDDSTKTAKYAKNRGLADEGGDDPEEGVL